MSSKLPFIPVIPNYQYIKDEMQKDFDYRMNERKDSTEFGRPLYRKLSQKNVWSLAKHMNGSQSFQI